MKFLAILALSLLASAASALNLPVPPGYPILLGVSCGGVAVTATIAGFDSNGNVTGELKAFTRCNGSGRGARSTPYTSYHTITWDFFGGYVLSGYDGGSLDTATVAVDAFGNTAQIVSINYVPKPTLTINNMPPGATRIANAIPATNGQPKASVSAALVGLGFIPAFTYSYSSGVTPSGVVLYTIPAAGLMEPVGTVVQVIVSATCDGVTVNCD